jgi:Lipase (class 3)
MSEKSSTGARSLLLACFVGSGLALLGGCNTVPFEKGAIWCNEPLKYEPGVHFDRPHLEVARRGYLYALAAAYTLQGNSDEDHDHWFKLPPRMKEVDRPSRDSSGFEVRTFELRTGPNDNDPKEIIVAFTGSNDRADWISTNLFFSRSQYQLASDYLEEIAARYPSKRIVVTGFSLGGALAGHVTKSDRTRSIVSEAWLFNPSPKLYANDKYDKRIWIGALRGEVLHAIRSRPFELLWPGINRIGAPWQQDAQDFYLISAFPIYGH